MASGFYYFLLICFFQWNPVLFHRVESSRTPSLSRDVSLLDERRGTGVETASPETGLVSRALGHPGIGCCFSLWNWGIEMYHVFEIVWLKDFLPGRLGHTWSIYVHFIYLNFWIGCCMIHKVSSGPPGGVCWNSFKLDLVAVSKRCAIRQGKHHLLHESRCKALEDTLSHTLQGAQNINLSYVCHFVCHLDCKPSLNTLYQDLT